MTYKKVKVADIVPYENNPRIIDNAIDPVAESIRQVGYITPIVVDENMVVLAGHTRLQALKKIGTKEVQVLVAEGLSEEQKKKYRLYDNKAGELASWDTSLLKEELFDVDFGDFDFGQPKPDEDPGADGKTHTVVCPCCGEEFVVGAEAEAESPEPENEEDQEGDKDEN